MELKIFKTPEQVITALAEFVIKKVNKSIQESGSCNLVLSGGNSPRELYKLLSTDLYSKQVNWSKVWFFFGDERFVPFTDPGNNGQMAKQFLLDPLKIDSSKIFYINTELEPLAAAADYEKLIRSHFGRNAIRFDLILLGLGDNAHTASLFPHTKVLYEMKSLVKAVFIEEISSWRITMTAPLINESQEIVFLVYGPSKAIAVQHILKGSKNIENYPAQLIEAEDGTVSWFLDRAAAELI